MKMIGKKKVNVFRSLKCVLVGCLLSVMVCAVTFAADPKEFLGDDFGIDNLDTMISAMTVKDVENLKSYMAGELMERIECSEDDPVEYLNAYLVEDETFVFAIKDYYENSLSAG